MDLKQTKHTQLQIPSLTTAVTLSNSCICSGSIREDSLRVNQPLCLAVPLSVHLHSKECWLVSVKMSKVVLNLIRHGRSLKRWCAKQLSCFQRHRSKLHLDPRLYSNPATPQWKGFDPKVYAQENEVTWYKCSWSLLYVTIRLHSTMPCMGRFLRHKYHHRESKDIYSSFKIHFKCAYEAFPDPLNQRCTHPLLFSTSLISLNSLCLVITSPVFLLY